ncbi:hypothetical protein [Oceanobacillus halophilus]|uniref:DUF1404 domain-containing protein n=1 Tax=Oceanobacillus halophilus TaxID=930130 RepID=A0A495A4V5_9BACI|nr:hypothetical protein [Oceanobacillus halophilus]RKQ34678.1 hypothetical protein D8M06_07085 [Oceanobacillus halophilus]
MGKTRYGIVLFVLLLLPPIRLGMESIMIVHMLIQLPLLILAGWLTGDVVVRKFYDVWDRWNGNGIPGIILVFFITLFWMFPRTLDEALTYNSMEFLKFISLPFVGLLLRGSWEKLHTLGKTFIYLNYLSMFGLFAWLYIDSPIQICNNYLETQQKVLGWGMLFITVLMILSIIHYVFTDHSKENVT